MQDRYLRNVHSQWEEKIFCHGMFYIKKEKGWRLVFVSSVQKTFHCFDKYLDHVIYYATMTRINMIKNGGGEQIWALRPTDITSIEIDLSTRSKVRKFAA